MPNATNLHSDHTSTIPQLNQATGTAEWAAVFHRQEWKANVKYIRPSVRTRVRQISIMLSGMRSGIQKGRGFWNNVWWMPVCNGVRRRWHTESSASHFGPRNFTATGRCCCATSGPKRCPYIHAAFRRVMKGTLNESHPKIWGLSEKKALQKMVKKINIVFFLLFFTLLMKSTCG